MTLLATTSLHHTLGLACLETCQQFVARLQCSGIAHGFAVMGGDAKSHGQYAVGSSQFDTALQHVMTVVRLKQHAVYGIAQALRISVERPLLLLQSALNLEFELGTQLQHTFALAAHIA